MSGHDGGRSCAGEADESCSVGGPAGSDDASSGLGSGSLLRFQVHAAASPLAVDNGLLDGALGGLKVAS